MDINNKKILKKTTIIQFQKLAELIEEYPQLATGSPAFGSSRVAVEETWDNVAIKVNALGPPTRSGSEWKKVWQDQKCRVKKKIAENNKSLHGTGGGPCTVHNLTQMELHIDRICHLSSAAAPCGTVLGLPSAHKTIQITPPRSNMKVAVVTPTTSKQADVNKKIQHGDSSDIFTANTSHISPQIITEFLHQSLPQSQQQIITSTPKEIKRQLHQNRKRKNIDNNTERLKLLRQQIDIQNKTLDIMNKHAEAAKMQAEAAKVQAESAKVQAEALRIQAQAATEQTKALKEISDASKVIGQALLDIIKHLKDEE